MSVGQNSARLLRLADPLDVMEDSTDRWWDEMTALDGWCLDARRWLLRHGADDPATAWRTCPVGAWMIFALTTMLKYVHGRNDMYESAFGSAVSTMAYGTNHAWATSFDYYTLFQHRRAANRIREVWPELPLALPGDIPIDTLDAIARGDEPFFEKGSAR